MDFYNTLGDLKKAKDAGEKAEKLLSFIKYSTYLQLYHFMKGLIFLNQGEYKNALSHIDIAIEKLPSADFPEYFHILNEIIKAEILGRIGEFEQSLKLAQKTYHDFKKHYPNDSNYKLFRNEMILAFIYLKKENLNQSLKYISSALQGLNSLFQKDNENPIQAFSHVILGEIYEKEGELPHALEEYQTAESIYSHIFKTIEVDDISYLYKNYVTLGAKMKDELMIKKYLQLLTDHFGLDHKRTKEAVQYLDEQKLPAFS